MPATAPAGDRVDWVQSDARGPFAQHPLRPHHHDRHAFRKLLTDGEIEAASRAFACHLSVGGKLAFETRNPLNREWEEWVPELSRTVVTLPDGSKVDTHNDIRSVVGELVTYETHVGFGPHDQVVGADTLRFISRRELTQCLNKAGFVRQIWYGNWDCLPVGPQSPELIVIAQL